MQANGSAGRRVPGLVHTDHHRQDDQGGAGHHQHAGVPGRPPARSPTERTRRGSAEGERDHHRGGPYRQGVAGERRVSQVAGGLVGDERFGSWKRPRRAGGGIVRPICRVSRAVAGSEFRSRRQPITPAEVDAGHEVGGDLRADLARGSPGCGLMTAMAKLRMFPIAGPCPGTAHPARFRPRCTSPGAGRVVRGGAQHPLLRGELDVLSSRRCSRRARTARWSWSRTRSCSR